MGGKLEKLSVISDSFLKAHSEEAVSSQVTASFSAEVGASGLGNSIDVSGSGIPYTIFPLSLLIVCYSFI